MAVFTHHHRQGHADELSRRAFLRGSGAVTAGMAAAEAALAPLARAAPEAGAAPVLGPEAVPLTLTVNGAARRVVVEPRATLAEVLRDTLQLTGTKVACDRGACGACTVLLDGVPVNSCSLLALDVGARAVTTIEGIATGAGLHPVQAAFIAHDAMQCGFCTPGMVLAAVALLGRNPKPSAEDVKAALSGHLCRCGSHAHIVEAVLAASRGGAG